MSEDLYQEALVAMAKSGVGAGRLEAPDGTATADNPLCGDRVTVDVRMDGDRVQELAHKTRG
ncbi:MAG: iron-sulfur cluster assembly scaffold protein, partial [Geminicoccaceae bacterium]|nr:iron-sulfur cluster assembly scaffold protein [Geminicoccaceae bacterium]